MLCSELGINCEEPLLAPGEVISRRPRSAGGRTRQSLSALSLLSSITSSDVSSVAHLDTSALVKRYVEERGSEGVDRLFDSAYRGRAILALSIFNVEAACALDRKARRGELAGSAQRAVSLMLREVRTPARLGSLRLAPLTSGVLRDSISVALRRHIYMADALQVAGCAHARCDALYTADSELARVATNEGLKVVMIGGP